MVLVLDTRSDITPKYVIFLLLHPITNENNVKLIQLDTISSILTPDPTLAGSNNSGKHALLGPYSLVDEPLTLLTELCALKCVHNTSYNS